MAGLCDGNLSAYSYLESGLHISRDFTVAGPQYV